MCRPCSADVVQPSTCIDTSLHAFQSSRGLARRGRNPCEGESPGGGRTRGGRSAAGEASSGRVWERRRAGAHRGLAGQGAARLSTPQARRGGRAWGGPSMLAA